MTPPLPGPLATALDLVLVALLLYAFLPLLVEEYKGLVEDWRLFREGR